MDSKRERWAGRLPFIMAAVGSAVGLGNIWRFPKVVFDNGGGVFLIPYFIALITAGIPLMIVEYALGQKYQGGAPQAISAVTKKFKWVGWFALLVGTVITFYYVAIMAWAFHFTFASFNISWTKPFDRVEYEHQKEIEELIVPEDQNVTGDNTVFYAEYKTDAEKKQLTQNLEHLDIVFIKKDERDKLKEKHPDKKLISLQDLYKVYGFSHTADLEKCRKIIKKENISLYYIYKNDDKKARLNEILGKYNVKIVTQEELEHMKTINPDKTYIRFSQNIKSYFYEKTLDYQAGLWKELNQHNRGIETKINRIKEKQEDIGGELTAEQKAKIKNLEQKKISYIGHMMKPSWHLFIGAFITWLIIFLVIYKGVRNVGKVVMFTVPVPVLIIIIIIIRGLFLKGAWEGLEFYLKPDLSKLFHRDIWIAAYGQIFFSLSLGFGILIAYASYMPEDSDISNNAFLTSFANCSTSFIGGFAVFTVLGYMAHISGLNIDEVVNGGLSLAFVTYPTAISQMGGGFWSIIIGVLFFLCLLTLGIDSAFSILEGVITGVRDHFKIFSKPVLTAFFCVIGFLVTAFVYTSRSGLMWLDITDNWMSNYGLPIVGLFECLAIGYFADIEELKSFVNKHSEIKIHYWFDAFIKVITPSILIFLIASQVITDINQTYGNYDTVLPWSVAVAGWGLFALLLFGATLLAKSYNLLMWEISSGVIYVFFYAVYSLAEGVKDPKTTAAMTTLGTVLLLGGFLHCLFLALTEKLPAGEGRITENETVNLGEQEADDETKEG